MGTKRVTPVVTEGPLSLIHGNGTDVGKCGHWKIPPRYPSNARKAPGSLPSRCVALQYTADVTLQVAAPLTWPQPKKKHNRVDIVQSRCAGCASRMPARVGSDWLVADRFSSLGAYGAVKRRKQRSPATIQGTCHGIYRAALEQEVRKMTRAPASSMLCGCRNCGHVNRPREWSGRDTTTPIWNGKRGATS